MDNVTIRRATAGDKEAVCRINNDVYEGRDYLPAYYDHFLTSEAMFPAVMLYEQQIIAYVLGQVIDNCGTIVNRAGRINPKYEGQGLISKMNLYLFDWGLSKGATTKAYTTSDANPSLQKPSYRNLTKHIMTKQFPMYYFTGQGITLSEEDLQYTTQLRSIGRLALSLYFTSKVTRDYIAPEGRLIVDSVPYKLVNSNIPFMMEPKSFTVVYSNIQEVAGHCTGLLSFGIVFPVPRPQYKYIIDIFGNDTTSVRLHILKHLLRLKAKTTGVTAFVVFVPEQFHLRKVDSVLEGFGILRRPHKSVYAGLKSRQIYAYEVNDQNLSNL